jgi:hypothetical protein
MIPKYIIVGIFTLIGAIVGTFSTYIFNTIRDNKLRKEQVNALLQAIHEEIGIIMDRYSQVIGEPLKNLKDDKVLNFYDILTPQDFIIYNSNAGLIGQIKDDKLRKNIVRFYTLVKGFSNTALYTNKIILIFQDYMSQHPEYTEPNSNPLIRKVIKTYQDYLNGFMKELKSQYNELECSSKILKELIVK